MTKKEMENQLMQVERAFSDIRSKTSYLWEKMLRESTLTANVEHACGVTLQELAEFVLDKKPITRDSATEVYKP